MDIDHNRQRLAIIEQELADQVGITHSAKVTLTDTRDFKAAMQQSESDLHLNQSVSNLRAPKTKLVTRIDTVEMLMENMRYDLAAIRKDFAVHDKPPKELTTPEKGSSNKTGASSASSSPGKKQIHNFSELVHRVGRVAVREAQLVIFGADARKQRRKRV